MKIDLIGLEVDIEFDTVPAHTGGIDEFGNAEIIPISVSLNSVICKGIEIITLLESSQREVIEEEIIENL